MQKPIAAIVFLVLALIPISLEAWARPGSSEELLKAPRFGSERLYELPPGDTPLTVDVQFTLGEIDDFDDESETFQFTGVLTLSWHDPRQAFDPELEGFAERLYIGDYQFSEVYSGWWPQVVLRNEAGMYERHGVMLRVRSDGFMMLEQKVNAIAKSKLDLRRVPFDTQRVEAIFQILGFESSEVVLRTVRGVGEDASNLNKEYNVPQWHLSSMDLASVDRIDWRAGREVIASTVEVGIDLQRDPFFFLRLVVLPLAIMVMLSWTIFWMDMSSLGDRINVSFIGILTAVAYQMMLNETLPQISYVTLLNAFLNVSFLTMCASVLVNLRVSFLDRHGRADQGDRLDRRCRWMFPSVYFGLLLLAPVVISFLPAP